MADNNHRRNCGQSLIAGAGLGVLTVNSGLAMYRARGDVASVLFVAGSYLLLLLLFACLRAYERAAPGSPARERARRAVWPLTTLLTVAFAWKVAAVMPSAAACALFIAASYLLLLLLFACLRAYERAHRREELRNRIWCLCTLLTLMFAWKVASVMPWPTLTVAVWALAADAAVGGFFALFVEHV